MSKPVRKKNGKEWITATELAKRLEVTDRGARYFLNKNNVANIFFDNNTKTRYFDYEQAVFLWGMRDKVTGKPTLGERKKKEEAQGFIAVPKKPRVTKIDSPTIPNNDFPKDDAPKQLVDIEKLNPFDYPDCWKLTPEQEPIYHPITNKPALDYEKLKLRLTAEKYQQDIDERRGKFVDRDTMTRLMQNIAKIIETALDAIPRRYGATLMASVEDMTKHSFTPDEGASIRAILKNEAPSIMNSIQTEIAKLEDTMPNEKQ